MRKLVFAAFFIVMGLSLQAQIATYLAPGKSGVGIQVLGEQGSKFQGFGGHVSATYKGKLDITVFGASDVYGKEANDLSTDKGLGNYFEAKATWWLFRSQLTPGIEASFGLMAGYDGAKFTDMISNNPDDGEYMGFNGVMAGMHASVNLQLNPKWTLQPAFIAYYDTGKDLFRHGELIMNPNYTNVISNICVSLIRKVGEKNALVISANNFYMSTAAGGFYNLTAGYIFGF